MDAMFLTIALVAFLGLVLSWLVLPASTSIEPSRVAVSRRIAAEA